LLPKDELPPGTFRQVGSLSWWLSEPPPTSSPDRSEAQPSAPETLTQEPAVKAAPDPSPDIPGPDLGEVVKTAFEKTHRGLRGHAEYLGVELADLSSTALALLVNLETGKVAAGQVGDGALLGLTARGEAVELVKPDDTEDAQATYTINRPNFGKHLVVQVVDPADAAPYLAFFVMTDGLSGDLLYADRRALYEWAMAVDRNLRRSPTPAQAAAGMLNWLATYEVRGSWDDRTLVVITRKDRPNGDDHTLAGQPEPARRTVGNP
jgi:hypothetical protein